VNGWRGICAGAVHPVRGWCPEAGRGWSSYRSLSGLLRMMTILRRCSAPRLNGSASGPRVLCLVRKLAEFGRTAPRSSSGHTAPGRVRHFQKRHSASAVPRLPIGFQCVGIEWVSVIVSTGVSALISGVVSVVTARHIVEQQETGRSAAEARRQIAAIVEPQLTKARQYQSRALASLGRDPTEHVLNADDVLLCGRILVTSANLGRWRRRLVRRRLRNLFGDETVNLCATHGQDATNYRGAAAMVLQRQAMALMHPEHKLAVPNIGQFDRALRRPPDSKEVSDLIESLTRLAQCR